MFNSNTNHHINMKLPSASYPIQPLNLREKLTTTDNMNSGKSCSNCKHFTQSSKCHFKGNKQVKSYNICQYHNGELIVT